ncbi:Cytosolic non-specific dipeptidase [Hondaea fermentalgiana]|uniref:Cytosolic non-specific dipeptidase n=1 Tax=Hondaea fermentalgiana TaxID=2315210 RepID=A0A2R5G8X9_9STRA|nr:Cytosolic non-specific dipeptidase [Hondaea fermentalgiana]|eukprot:GBG26789.1 Cytosolic non-specific dipeptidase [Hondaea fermentalgiana]
MANLDETALASFVDSTWKEDCIPKLCEYVAIPNQSPLFVEKDDAEAKENQDKAMALIQAWVEAQDVNGMSVDLVQLEERTPLLFIEVSPSEGVDLAKAGTVLLYGHMDKQPPFEGWEEGLEPYKPVVRDGKLYGRGGADDGYSVFTAVTAIRALQKQGVPHARCVIIIEACEESGSPDLSAYVTHLKDRIGSPNLVVCLDSGAGNYEQLWVTTSLRGVCVGNLSVEISREGVHSGDASGILPDSFRIARRLLDRIEDADTGRVTLPGLVVDIPEKVRKQVADSAAVLGRPGMIDLFPFVEGAVPVEPEGEEQLTELALNRWWRAQLTVTGADGLPPAGNAGNVLRPSTTLRLSIRLPPTLPGADVVKAIQTAVTTDVPYGAKVSFSGKVGSGWAAPPMASWLEEAASAASKQHYGKDAMIMGEGGSIPFMGMLGTMFPQAQFLIVGVLGPASNAHGPNEFLHIDFSSKLTSCIASVLAKQCAANVEELLTSGNGADLPPAKRAKVDEFGRNADGTKL